MENQITNNEPGQKTILAILAYLGPLVIVSYLIDNNDPFVKFHIKQGLVLLTIEAIAWALSMLFWLFSPFAGIINVATLILAIIGIINVVNNRQKELPVVGSYSKYFTF